MNLIYKSASMLSVLALSLALSFSASANSATDNIIERIKSVGQVCLEGDDTCGGTATTVATSAPARTGVEIYQTKCALCHGAGVSGAPIFGTVDWTERGADGIDSLLAAAIKGIGAMPPKGLCADCSDTELRDAIELMVNSAP